MISDEVKRIMAEVLDLGASAKDLSPQTLLAGYLPEFDSMAAVAILTAIEEQFDVVIEDDEIDGTIFESVASLIAFVSSKTAG